jgi:hypothetical protein
MAPKMDEFVSKIVTDPKNPPNTLLLKGFIGTSSEQGHIRLYLDNELSDYVEIPEAAILYSQGIPKEKSPIGGSYIWIQRNATVIHGAVVADRPRASFLEGRIMNVNPAAPIPPQTITGPVCGTIIDGCTDSGPKCPTTTGKTCPDPCTASGPLCTQTGPNCPVTHSGTTCPAPGCTQSGPNCPTPNCPTTPGATCSGPNCPTTPDTTCCGPHCPTFPANTCSGPKCQTVSPNATCIPGCTQSGPNCPTTSGNVTCPAPICTQSGPGCPTTSPNATCPTPICTRTGPNCQQTVSGVTCVGPHCQTINDPACPFPTEAGKTCVAPCHQP